MSIIQIRQCVPNLWVNYNFKKYREKNSAATLKTIAVATCHFLVVSVTLSYTRYNSSHVLVLILSEFIKKIRTQLVNSVPTNPRNNVFRNSRLVWSLFSSFLSRDGDPKNAEFIS